MLHASIRVRMVDLVSRLSRADWIDAALAELIRGGPAAVRIEPLAAGLGATKGSFYHHFSTRDELLGAVLEVCEASGTRQVIDRVEAAAAEPLGQLQALAGEAFGSSTELAELEGALRAWAGHDATVQAAVARVDERRLSFVTELLCRQGLPRPVARTRSALLYRAMVGDFAWRAAGGTALSAQEIEEFVALSARPVALQR